MFTIKSRLLVPATFVALVACATISYAQCCSGCGGGGAWPGTCAGGAAGVGGGHLSGHFNDHYHKLKAEFELVTARNSAWPLPFTCMDREAYYALWNAQWSTGLQVAHTLTAEYFHPETNQLNSAGQARVAWIMQNSPASDRVIYVMEDQTGPTVDQRMRNVRATVHKWYGHMGAFDVASTKIKPNNVPAMYQEQISANYFEGQAVPTIPVGSSGSIATSVNR